MQIMRFEVFLFHKNSYDSLSTHFNVHANIHNYFTDLIMIIKMGKNIVLYCPLERLHYKGLNPLNVILCCRPGFVM